MSKYAFCKNCKEIVKKPVKSVTGKGTVEEWSCVARFNPYEPTHHNDKKNKHGCPHNERFMLMERRKELAHTYRTSA